MSFDRAIETIKATIARQRASAERLANADQQTYLETVQDAVSQIVACIEEAHRLSKEPGGFSSLSGLNYLRQNSAKLTRLGKAFGKTENLVIQDSKTAEIGSDLIVFFTQFLATHPRWTSTVHKETQEKIQTLKTNLERFNKEAYRQRLTTVIEENPLDAVDLTHVIRVDADDSEWQVVPSVATLNSDELGSYQTTMEEIRSEANKLRDSLHKVQTLQRALLAVPFPAGTDSKPEVFDAIREEKLSSLKEKIDIQRRQLNLLEDAFRAIQNAYFQRANQEGQISPAAREEQRTALNAKIARANDRLRESDGAFSTKAGVLKIEASCQLEDLEQEINASKREGDAVNRKMTEAREQYTAKIARLNRFITRLKGEHEAPVLSTNCDELIKELGYDLAKDLHDIWMIRMEYTCVTEEINLKSWFGSPKTSAREKLYALINARVNGLNHQHETKMSASTQESEGIHSRTTALIELAHQKLQVQLHALKYHHHQINQIHTEINLTLADVQAEIKSLKAFQTECSGTNAPERFVEYQDVYDKLQAWLEKHGQKITALQWQIAEQNRRQEKSNRALSMAALAPIPAAFTEKKQQMATLTQAQNDTMETLRTTYTEIDSLCQWFTKLKLVKILAELNTLNAQETEDPKEKQRLLVSIKNALKDLTHQKTWLAQIPTHQGNYQLAQDIFGVEAQLCEKQANLLLAQHNSLATVKTHFFDDIFPQYLQQRAVKYYWLDAFSKLLGFVLSVFGYKTEAKARTEYLAKLQTKWTTFEQQEDHPTAELTSFIDQGLKFSPRKLNDPNSLRAQLCLFKSAVEEVSSMVSSEKPSHGC